jgi:hypothetical protein
MWFMHGITHVVEKRDPSNDPENMFPPIERMHCQHYIKLHRFYSEIKFLNFNRIISSKGGIQENS